MSDIVERLRAEANDTYGHPLCGLLIEAADEIEWLRWVEQAAGVVLATFKKDEADGYQSRDRQYAIAILGRALEEK